MQNVRTTAIGPRKALGGAPVTTSLPALCGEQATQFLSLPQATLSAKPRQGTGPFLQWPSRGVGQAATTGNCTAAAWVRDLQSAQDGPCVGRG